MKRKNKKCPVCGKEFHACLSCGHLHHEWEFKYCSRGCYYSSEEYIKTKFIFEKIYNKMKKDTLHSEFIELLEKSKDFKIEIENWIMELEDCL